MLLNFSIMRFQIRQMCKYVRDTTVCLLWDFDHLIEFCLKALFSITHMNGMKRLVIVVMERTVWKFFERIV